ncbi:MAG TPA: putative metallopeptidase [Patescibacteria group bacterium]|nr:putative metallopeptidase [Patescibacteria group bacterium]
MEFVLAPDIASELKRIIVGLDFQHLKPQNIVAFRSFGSKSRAVARIWSLPHIWQLALEKEAHYCVEVISEKFDGLSSSEKEKVLIHELLHIPKNFSGALLPHRHQSQRIDRRTVEHWHARLYNKNSV